MVKTRLSILSLSSAIYQAKPTCCLFSRGFGIRSETLHQSLRSQDHHCSAMLGRLLTSLSQVSSFRCKQYSFAHFGSGRNFHIHNFVSLLYASCHKSCQAGDTVQALQIKRLRFREGKCFASGYNKELRSADLQVHVLPTTVCWSWPSPPW